MQCFFFSEDRTETGHILGRAEVRGQGPIQERLLSPVHCSFLRLLTHMSMYLAAANDPQVKNQGPVVQSIVSLMSSLMVKMLTVLVSSIPNSQVFLLKKCELFLQMHKLLTFFQQKY